MIYHPITIHLLGSAGKLVLLLGWKKLLVLQRRTDGPVMLYFPELGESPNLGNMYIVFHRLPKQAQPRNRFFSGRIPIRIRVTVEPGQVTCEDSGPRCQGGFVLAQRWGLRLQASVPDL